MIPDTEVAEIIRTVLKKHFVFTENAANDCTDKIMEAIGSGGGLPMFEQDLRPVPNALDIKGALRPILAKRFGFTSVSATVLVGADEVIEALARMGALRSIYDPRPVNGSGLPGYDVEKIIREVIREQTGFPITSPQVRDEAYEIRMALFNAGALAPYSAPKEGDAKEFSVTVDYSSGKTIVTGPVASENLEHDPVNHPKHYTSSPATCSGCGNRIECIQVVRHMSYNIGNIVKYLWRCDLKNGLEDLKKAAYYLADEIAERESGSKKAAP